MTEFKTTLGKIKSFRPCETSWKKLVKTVGNSNDEAEVTLLQVLDSNGPQDAYWALRCWDYKEYALLLANVAESVVHIYAKRNPGDDRVQKCIDTIRAYVNGNCSKGELKAAADAAADAAYAADAYAADAYAAYAAAYAAAAYAYATDAAAAYAYAAAAAAAYAYATDADAAAQWERNGQMMRDFVAMGV